MEVGHEQDIVRATDFQLLQEQEEVLHAFELEVIQTMQEQVAALTPYFMDRLVIKALAHRLIALVVQTKINIAKKTEQTIIITEDGIEI